MAQGVLSPIAGGIINIFGPLAADEIKLLCSVQNEVEKLKGTVSTIKKVLLQAEELRALNPAVEEWLGRLGDTVYKAEDLLDAVSTEVLRQEIMRQGELATKVCKFFFKANQLVFRLKVAHEIKAIRGKLQDLENDRKFHLDERPVETIVRGRERNDTYSYLCEELIIGRDADKEAIISMMGNSVEGNVLIIPIVGHGGFGKTALAKLIFDDVKIKEKEFELKMWVFVSNNFDVKIIIKKILEEAKRESKSDNMNQLVNYLRSVIDGKKYLLVLDDVWNEDYEKWSQLINSLMVGARGSVILVTTRSQNLAKAIPILKDGIICVKPYELKGLGKEESWKLFEMIAFPRGQESKNSHMVNIGRKILEKCRGVPLAIRVVGNLLYIKHSKAEWSAFKDNELFNIPEIEEGVFKTLKLSYYKLPSHLKHCFVYCKLFPNNHFMYKSNLIELWMAQGFSESEDVGNEYFMDLLRGSFFQEAEEDYFGNIFGCKMHDLIHDLATSVTGLETVIFDPKKRNINEKTRHIAVYGNTDFSLNEWSSLHKATMIRTFYGSSDFFGATIDYGAILSSYKGLRVLNLSGRRILCVPSSIGKLIHFRYLDLSANNFKELPNSITELQNLQTLNCDDCCFLAKLPRDIKKLVNLRHLCNDLCFELSFMPRGLGKLTDLRTLKQFSVGSGSFGCLDELERLNNLTGLLRIEGLNLRRGDASEYKKANLKQKTSVYILVLVWKEDEYKDSLVDNGLLLEGLEPHPYLKSLFILKYPGSVLPSWLPSLKNLVSLVLISCGRWRYLPPLGGLPSLKDLRIHRMEALEHMENSGIWNELSSSSSAAIEFFPSLETLVIGNCPKLMGWWTGDSSGEHHSLPSFPCLSELTIVKCPKLTLMPMFPQVEKLVMRKTRSEPLEQMMKKNTSAATTSSFSPLPKLKFAHLTFVPDYFYLMEWWEHLKSN